MHTIDPSFDVHDIVMPQQLDGDSVQLEDGDMDDPELLAEMALLSGEPAPAPRPAPPPAAASEDAIKQVKVEALHAKRAGDMPKAKALLAQAKEMEAQRNAALNATSDPFASPKVPASAPPSISPAAPGLPHFDPHSQVSTALASAVASRVQNWIRPCVAVRLVIRRRRHRRRLTPTWTRWTLICSRKW